MQDLVELLTRAPCGEACPGCEELDRAIQAVVREFGLPAPGRPARAPSAAAALGRRGQVVLRHVGCDEEVAAALPCLRVNGRVALAGPGWREEDARRALARFLRSPAG